MRHLKYFNINENYQKLTSDKIESIGSKLYSMGKVGFYELVDLTGKKWQPQDFRDIYYTKKEIIDIFGDINIILNSNNSLSFMLGDLNVIIRSLEDEWFIVSIYYTISRLYGTTLRNSVVFKCDQESGLLALLKDFKSLIDKNMNI